MRPLYQMGFCVIESEQDLTFLKSVVSVMAVANAIVPILFRRISLAADRIGPADAVGAPAFRHRFARVDDART